MASTTSGGRAHTQGTKPFSPEPNIPPSCQVMASPKCVGEGMQAALAWMAATISGGRTPSQDATRVAVKAAAMGAGYKTAPVREAAVAVMGALLAAVGGAEVNGAVQALEGKALKQAAQEAISKAGGSAAAAAPAPAAAAAGGSRPGTAGGSRVGDAAARAGAGSGSRPGTAASGSSARSTGSRAGAGVGLGAAAGKGAAAAPADEGALLLMDTKKEERAKKVGGSCVASGDALVAGVTVLVRLLRVAA